MLCLFLLVKSVVTAADQCCAPGLVVNQDKGTCVKVEMLEEVELVEEEGVEIFFNGCKRDFVVVELNTTSSTRYGGDLSMHISQILQCPLVF